MPWCRSMKRAAAAARSSTCPRSPAAASAFRAAAPMPRRRAASSPSPGSSPSSSGPYGINDQRDRAEPHPDRAHPAALGPAEPGGPAGRDRPHAAAPRRRGCRPGQGDLFSRLERRRFRHRRHDRRYRRKLTVERIAGLRRCAAEGRENRDDIRTGSRLLSGRLDLAAVWRPGCAPPAMRSMPRASTAAASARARCAPASPPRRQADEIAQLLFYEDLKRCRAGRHQLGRHGGVPRRRVDARPGRPPRARRCAGAAARREDPRHRHPLDGDPERHRADRRPIARGRRQPAVRRPRSRDPRLGARALHAHPIGIYNEPVKLDSFWAQPWKASVIWCRRAQNPGEAHQRRAADRLKASWAELDTGHYPMLSMPEELTRLLLAG